VNVRKYEIKDPLKVAELRRQLAENFFEGAQVELDAHPVTDDLSARRGEQSAHPFAFSVISIDRVPEGLQATAQDVETLDWATLTVTDTTATIMVVTQ
jgi:hypothetical protein